MEKHEVEAFLAVAEELHFGRAAQRLRVSTTRVSQVVRALERRVGAPLFERTTRRVTPTAIGRELYAGLAPAWAEVNAAVERAVRAGRGITGTLRVAFADAAGAQLLTQVAELFRERHPQCTVEFREAQRAEASLCDGAVDLALLQFPVRDEALTAGPVLVREARMLAVPVDKAGAADLETNSAARLETNSAGRLEITGGATLQELLTMVGAGLGTLEVGAHTRRYHPRPDVDYVHLPEAPPVEWGLAWRTSAATASVRAFTQAASDHASGR